MRLNILNNISLTKIAGIKNVLTIEIFENHINTALFQRNENIFKITSKSTLNNFSIIVSENFDTELNRLPSIAKYYIEKFGLKDIYLLVGINECIFKKINIPLEVEDDELWFLEHNENFIPEGKSLDEFIYSYKKIISDENFRQYFVITARKDYVEKIVKLCAFPGVNILAVLPFSTTLLTSQFTSDVNTLLLVFLNNKLQYVRKDSENYFDFGEIYYNDEHGEPPASGVLPSRMTDALNKLFQLFLQAKPLDKSDIVLSCPQNLNVPLRSYLLNNTNMNVSIIDNHMNSEFLHHTLTVSNIFENVDNIFNLLPVELSAIARNIIEKKLWLNITLALGSIILILLLSANLFSSLLKNTQSSINEEKTVLSLHENQLKQLKIENTYYKTNLAILYKLKDKKNLYTNLLRSMTEITDAKCCLTDIEIINSNNNLNIVITGLSYSQTDVTDLIRKLETLKLFSNISLIYSSVYTPDESSANTTSENKGLIQFSLRYNYNVN